MESFVVCCVKNTWIFNWNALHKLLTKMSKEFILCLIFYQFIIKYKTFLYFFEIFFWAPIVLEHYHFLH